MVDDQDQPLEDEVQTDHMKALGIARGHAFLKTDRRMFHEILRLFALDSILGSRLIGLFHKTCARPR